MNDAQLGSRALFPDLQAKVYLNHASISPPSQPVIAAVTSLLTRYAQLGAGAFAEAAEQRNRLRARLAGLLGCAPADLAFTAATSHGLIALATCLPLASGDRIIGFRGEFPANVTPWEQAAAAQGATMVLLDQEGVSDADLLADVERTLQAGNVRLIACSAVQFSTGRAMPLADLATLAHQHGAALAVDAIQALGVMPIDVTALGIDYLAGGGHKWLMGVEGVGILYIAPHRLAELVPRSASWISHDEPFAFLVEGPGHLHYGREVPLRASLFEGHSLSAIGCVALEEGLSRIQAIGVDRVQAHVRAYNDALEQGLSARGFRSLRTPGSPSGTLSMLPPPGTDAMGWVTRLAEHGIILSGPDGKLRFSPHWPNALDEVEGVLAAVDALLG